MAKIVSEKIVIALSKILKDSDNDEQDTFLSVDEKATLLAAVEGLVDNPSIVVEIV